MNTDTALHPLLCPAVTADASGVPAALLDELTELAMAHDELGVRSQQLFEQLRKMLGQERLTLCLLGIQKLAVRDEPAGARLLAALLDAQTPGAQLLPGLRRLSSVHRLLVSDEDLVGEAFLADWKQRLGNIRTTALAWGLADDGDGDSRPVARSPLPLLRAVIERGTPSRSRPRPDAEDLELLASLVRLEADAFQERVSRLAGTIDPYRVTAVMRALPLLSRADTTIRDLEIFAGWLEAHDLETAFRRRVPREQGILDEGERKGLTAAFEASETLAPLAAIRRAYQPAPLPVMELAGAVVRLLALGRGLQREGIRREPLGLVDAVRLALTHRHQGVLVLDLPAPLAEGVGRILVSAGPSDSAALSGFEIAGQQLTLSFPRLGLGDRVWRHDLPTGREMLEFRESDHDQQQNQEHGEERTREEDATSASAIKQMVLNNMGSVSVLLGFLRNQKVTSIPGLVADVARRTRSGRVLEVIAGDRNLYTGHANKEVPRALLESPVNVSVKLLRRFIHVKYVSKTDLRRMARDTSRLRKEVCREIEVYLDSLG